MKVADVDISHLEIEDDTPVDNFQAEHAETQLEAEQQRAEQLAERLRTLVINPDSGIADIPHFQLAHWIFRTKA